MKKEKILENLNNNLEKLNNKISDFCIKECKSLCCRQYVLVINEKEKKLFPENRLRKRKAGGYFADIESSGGCPNLDDEFKCKVYSKRPSPCRSSPMVFDDENKENKIIKVMNDCPAFQQGLLDEFLSEFEKACSGGWKIFIAEQGEIGIKLRKWKK